MKIKNWNKKLIINYTVTFFILIVVTVIFAAYFIRLGMYDITLTTFSDYVTQENIDGFSNIKNKNLNLNEFNNNEIMLSKSLTTKYDLYASTDYSIKGLYELDKIQLIDYNKLELINTDPVQQSFDKSSSNRRFIDEWYEISNSYEIGVGKKLIDYAVPYIMGDFKLVLNKQSPIIQDMISNNEINNYCDYDTNMNDLNSIWYCSLEIIPKVVERNGTFVMGNNPRDVMALGLKANGRSINDSSDDSMEMVLNWYKNIIDGIKFQNNELSVTISNEDGWDVAYAFPGDPVLGIIDEWNGKNNWEDSIKFATPKEGTSLWFDAFTISKDVRDIDASYQLIEFLTKDDVQLGYFEAEEEEFMHLYGGLEYIYYQTPSRLVQNLTTLDPLGRNAKDFMMSDKVLMTDINKSVDLYNQSLTVHAYKDIEDRGLEITCTLSNSCGDTIGDYSHEFATYDQDKQDIFVYNYNLILSLLN